MQSKILRNYKFWIAVILLLGLAAALVGPRLYFYFQKQVLVQSYNEQYVEPLREDDVGGKTPQETMDMFITALEEDELKQASKYFFPKDQDEELARLQKLKREQNLEAFTQKMKEARADWTAEGDGLVNNRTRKQFSYEVAYEENATFEFQGQEFEFEAGTGTAVITFDLNTFTDVWKFSNPL